MKKYILSIIIIASMGMHYASALFAQSNQVDTMYMNKTAEFNYETQSGEITLENFVPGEMKVAREAKAIDAVLILDFSGSMKDEYSPETTYDRVVSDKQYSYLHFGSDSDGESDGKTAYAQNRDYSSNKHYVKVSYAGSDRQLYIVRKKGTQNSKTVYRHWMYFEIGTTRYYATADGQIIEAQSRTTPTFDFSGWPTDLDGNKIQPSQDGDSKYRQIYCTYKTMTGQKTSTRFKALEKGVNTFIDLLAQHASKTGLTDRISIVSFGGTSTNTELYFNPVDVQSNRRTADYYLNESKENYLLEATTNQSFNTSSNTWSTNDPEVNLRSGVVKRFVDVSDPGAVNVLKHSVTGFTLGDPNTPTHAGSKVGAALMQKWGRTTDGGKDVARFVIVFSDGRPTNKNSSESFDDYNVSGISEEGVGKQAVKQMYNLKHSTTKPCTVYSIYCPASSSEGGSTSNAAKFMQRMSSDYPDAQSCYAGTQLSEFKYYKFVSDDLAIVFEDITQEIIVVSESKYDVNTSLNDFVNNEFFQLPDSVDQSTAYNNILVYENKCAGYDSTTNKYSWGSFLDPAQTKQLTQADGIQITVTKKSATQVNDKIEISGYDYSKNWCGMDISKNPSVPHGARLIVKIPFVYKTSQVWGDLPTNTDSSGVSVVDSTGTKIDDKKYPVPTLPFCFITITRVGLHKGESAIFLIEKPDGSGGYSFVDKVVVNGNGTGIDDCALYGVPGETFRVTETNWNWAYIKTTNPQEKTVDKSVEPYNISYEFTGKHKEPDPSKSKHEQEKDPANLHNHDEAFKINNLSLPSVSK